MTLDGKIAPAPSGTTHPTDVAAGGYTGGWITGDLARKHVHQLRHQHDAIMAGVGTVIADDPLLTDRSGLPRRRPLLRVILDSFLRLPEDSRLVKSANNDVLVIYSHADDARRRALENLGLQLLQIGCGKSDARPELGRPDLNEVMRQLVQREITSVIIEGGATVNWTALSSGVVDKLFLYYAPKILGEGSVPFVAASSAEPRGCEPHAPAAHPIIRARHIAVRQFGEDFAVEGYLRDPYQL
jgi:diaminohydroxyphosphoribosylaminopyrimidine deaminase / 5-amino-6-(5-phosphoribosylamino)uracil reductase